MKIIRHLKNHVPITASAITMGNFDGMHLGHQLLLRLLKEEAAQRGIPSVVILFEPHPAEFFHRGQVPARLMRLRDKLTFLQAFGIDIVVCLRFDAQLAAMSAESFVRDILLSQLGMRVMVLGQDARFGHKRIGDIALLQRMATEHDFDVHVPDDHQQAGLRVSSTAVRDALAQGNMEAATQALGHPYVMSGRVMYGQQLGRTLGYPTANIACLRKHVPIAGVFVVQLELVATGETFEGVAHLAERMIVNDPMPLLEVNLFAFDRTIYGALVRVAFLHKLRDTMDIADLEQLKQVIAADVNQAKAWLTSSE
jgi:riboflavin kinase/FMN adenylyltransferase